MLEVSAFFREDLVKIREPGLSLVCYHFHRERGKRPISLLLSLPENSTTADSRAEQHSQKEGGRRAALHGRQPAADHHQSVLRHHHCPAVEPGASATYGRGRVGAGECLSDEGDGTQALHTRNGRVS